MGNKKMFFVKKLLMPPNTFIGGLGASYITTPADYTSKMFTITVDDITNFIIDGSNNVSFNTDIIHGNLNITGLFSSLTAFTHFLDIEHKFIKIVGRSIFSSNANLKYLYFGGLNEIDSNNSNGSVHSNANLLKVNFENATIISCRNFLLNADIKKLYLPNVTDMYMLGNYKALAGLTFLERAYMPNVLNYPHDYNDIRILFENVKITCKIYVTTSSFGTKDRNAWCRIETGTHNTGDTFTINGLVYTATPTPTNPGDYANNGSNQSVYTTNLRNVINSDTRIGGIGDVFADSNGTLLGLYVTGVLGVAGNAVTAFKNANPPTSFFGGHDIHSALFYARDRGCTIIECGAPIAVNAPSGLSYSNQTANSVDLNFTVPTPNANGTECFETWVDDGTLWRKLFEFKEIAGTGATLNLSEVITDVGTLTGTKIKIRTMDGQMNYSSFSNEITIV